MRTKILAICILALFVFGCARGQKKPEHEIDWRQDRINTLEAEVEKKDQTIGTLEDRVDYLEEQLEKQAKEMDKYRKTTGATGDVDTGDIIRVSDVSVEDVQAALANAGFYKYKVDGKLGPKTLEAIKDFQRDQGLKVDGIVGKKTWTKLRAFLVK